MSEQVNVLKRAGPSSDPRRYVALLRAVNVGGRSVKMAEVRTLFESLGLSDVATYIQSGNVIFSSPETDADRLARQLEKALAATLGIEIKVFVRTPAELKEAAAHNPFDPAGRAHEQRCHLMTPQGDAAWPSPAMRLPVRGAGGGAP